MSRGDVDFRLAVALFGLQYLQAWPVAVGPILNGALIDGFGWSPTVVGVLAAAEAATYAAGLLLAPPLARRAGVRPIATIGIIAFAAAGLVSLGAGNAVALGAVRAGAGFGLGLAVGAGATAIVGFRRPERSVAYLATLVALASPLLVYAASTAAQTLGPGGVFGVSLAPAILAVVMLLWFPTKRHAPAMTSASAGRLMTLSLTSPVLWAASIGLGAAGGAWAFVERIGLGADLSHDGVANALAWTNLASVLGGVVAVSLAGRQTRFWAWLGLGLFGASNMLLCVSGTPSAYVLSMIALSFFFVFVQPFLAGLAAAEDKTGRLLSHMQGGVVIVSALSPAVAGALMSLGGGAHLLWLLAPAFAASLAILAVSGRQRPALDQVQS